jgi:hypothetical protein
LLVWVPAEDVFTCRGVKILNGSFDGDMQW